MITFSAHADIIQKIKLIPRSNLFSALGAMNQRIGSHTKKLLERVFPGRKHLKVIEVVY